MEILYLVDRILTKLIQALFQFLAKKLRFSIRIQSSLGFMMGVLLAAETARYLLPEPAIKNVWGVWVYMVFYSLIYAASIVLCSWVKWVLFALHRFFDFDRATSQDKLYLDGYSAWGFVITGGLLLIYFHSFPNNVFSSGMLFAGFVRLTDDAYISFATRKRGTPKRKKYATQALADLLERCKGWLVPRPVPQT